MVKNLENKKSLLKLNEIKLRPNVSIKIPTVGEILDDEQHYYRLISSLTAAPFQYMVQLDDMGLDYTKISDYDLFRMLFPMFMQEDISIIFGDLDLSDTIFFEDKRDNSTVLYSPKNDILFDPILYKNLCDTLRKINLLEKITHKPGNEHTRKYLLKKERKRQKREAKRKKTYEPYLEKLVIALVNTAEFPYNYESCMNLSIYKFNQSLKQIQHKISFDNTMVGVYAGTVDTSKLSNKENLTWIPLDK